MADYLAALCVVLGVAVVVLAFLLHDARAELRAARGEKLPGIAWLPGGVRYDVIPAPTRKPVKRTKRPRPKSKRRTP
jgi:hypothetical protein